MWTKIMWDDKFGGKHERRSPAIFTSLKAAREQYNDVRKVDLCEVISST